MSSHSTGGVSIGPLQELSRITPLSKSSPVDQRDPSVTTCTVPPVGDEGIVTRGVRARKTGQCSKVPPEFQPAKETNALVPAKKPVWIVHPEHGEIVVAAGKTGPGPKSKLLKDVPRCPDGVQWIHVLRVFKPSAVLCTLHLQMNGILLTVFSLQSGDDMLC